MTEPYVGCYSFTWVVQWELFLHSHLFWFLPCYKAEIAPRCFLPLSLWPSSQSQLNDNLTETMKELQPPCYWQLLYQSQPAPQGERSCGAECKPSSPFAKPGQAGFKSNTEFNTWFWHCMSQYLISFWKENAVFTIYGITCMTQG